MTVSDKVAEAIRRQALISPGEKIIVGVSGGPDSVALLLLLWSLRKGLGIKLHVAHMDHMLRRGSSGDARFVERLAARLGLPVTVSRVEVARMAARGSMEEAARNARLAFFCGLCRRLKADAVALGHTRDDQAETVLMRILRGTGLYGLAGIVARRRLHGVTFIRPLLEVSRKEIESYLTRKKIVPRRDPSNEEDIYFRNKIRNRLIPHLEKEYNSAVREVLSGLGECAGYDYDFLQKAARTLHKGAGTRLPRALMERVHPAMRRELIREGIAALQGDTRRISLRHIKEIEDMFFNRPLDSIVDLPKGISVAKKKSHLLVYTRA